MKPSTTAFFGVFADPEAFAIPRLGRIDDLGVDSIDDCPVSEIGLLDVFLDELEVLMVAQEGVDVLVVVAAVQKKKSTSAQSRG